RRVRRPDRFVCLLRPLLLLAAPEARVHVVVAEALAQMIPCGVRGARRDACRVGSHVRDQTDGALGAQLHALVKLLRDAHRALCGETITLRRLLLQCRCRERRRWILRAFAALDLGDDERTVLHVVACAARVGLVVDRERLAVDVMEPGVERTLVLLEMRGDRPVLLRDERADLLLALGDQPQCNRLYASGGEPAPDRLPQGLARRETDETVQDAACLL